MQGRNTQGVRLINVGNNEKLVGLARVEEPDDEFEESDTETQSDSGDPQVSAQDPDADGTADSSAADPIDEGDDPQG
jgi:DNA gyrase subunit A